MRDSFPYVRAFSDDFGIHFLGSNHPLPLRTTAGLLQHMPPAAVKDLAEWEHDAGPSEAASSYLNSLHELSLDELIAAAPKTPALTDDRPINEYYAWRQVRDKHDWAILARGNE